MSMQGLLITSYWLVETLRSHIFAAIGQLPVAGSSIWVADTGASVHCTGDSSHMYSMRVPREGEGMRFVGNGSSMKVESIGWLDITMHCEGEDIVITLRDIAYVPGFPFDLCSLNVVMDNYRFWCDRKGAHMLDGRFVFRKTKNGSYLQETRVPRDGDFQPMIAAVLAPGQQKSIDINDLH